MDDHEQYHHDIEVMELQARITELEHALDGRTEFERQMQEDDDRRRREYESEMRHFDKSEAIMDAHYAETAARQIESMAIETRIAEALERIAAALEKGLR